MPPWCPALSLIARSSRRRSKLPRVCCYPRSMKCPFVLVHRPLAYYSSSVLERQQPTFPRSIRLRTCIIYRDLFSRRQQVLYGRSIHVTIETPVQLINQNAYRGCTRDRIVIVDVSRTCRRRPITGIHHQRKAEWSPSHITIIPNIAKMAERRQQLLNNDEKNTAKRTDRNITRFLRDRKKETQRSMRVAKKTLLRASGSIKNNYSTNPDSQLLQIPARIL